MSSVCLVRNRSALGHPEWAAEISADELEKSYCRSMDPGAAVILAATVAAGSSLIALAVSTRATRRQAAVQAREQREMAEAQAREQREMAEAQAREQREMAKSQAREQREMAEAQARQLRDMAEGLLREQRDHFESLGREAFIAFRAEVRQQRLWREQVNAYIELVRWLVVQVNPAIEERRRPDPPGEDIEIRILAFTSSETSVIYSRLLHLLGYGLIIVEPTGRERKDEYSSLLWNEFSFEDLEIESSQVIRGIEDGDQQIIDLLKRLVGVTQFSVQLELGGLVPPNGSSGEWPNPS
jgi:flagellar biosynthesis GTPase FlhF